MLALALARIVRSIPSVVIQIVTGIVLGAGILSLNPHDSAIQVLSNVGLFAIFFRVGLDFDLSAPELTSTTPIRSAIAGVATSGILVFLTLRLLGNSTYSSFLVALATVSTSVSVAIYSFLSLGPLVHLEAKVAVIAGLFDDLLGLSILAVLSSILSKSLGGAISLVVSLSVVAVAYAAQRKLNNRSFELSPFPRYSLVMLLVACVVFLWQGFGLTLAIAGFVAGAISGPLLSRKDQRVLGRASGLLGPFFMVSLGLLVRFRGSVSWMDLIGVILMSAALILSKGAAALVMGNQLDDKILYWFSMVPRAEVAGIGMVLIAPEVSASLELQAILAVVVTSLITPLVINRRAKPS